MKSISEPVVSCRVAQWICSADALCSTALDYYNHYCRSMFHGKKCTSRCNNSISILRRQEKAAKLSMCKCDGLEDYDCVAIQKNMNRLCAQKHPHYHDTTKYEPEPAPARPPTSSVRPNRPASKAPPIKKDKTEPDKPDSAAINVLTWTTILCTVIMTLVT